MPSGGKITLSAANVDFDEPDSGATGAAGVAVADSGRQAGEYVEFCVRDSGGGMNVEEKARAFEPFSPPRMWVRARALASAWSMSSLSNRVDLSISKVNRVREPPYGCTYPAWHRRWNANLGRPPAATRWQRRNIA